MPEYTVIWAWGFYFDKKNARMIKEITVEPFILMYEEL